MSKEIYFARHCATMMNDQDRLQGSWMDFPLSENGENQAYTLKEDINKELNNKKFDLVIASPTSRAIQTGEIVSPRTRMLIDSRITVYDIGTADAEKIEDVYAFKGFPIPGIYKKMENPYKYYKRLKEFFEDIKNNPLYDNKTILVVTHKDITALANHFLLGEGLLSSLKMGLKNGEYKKFELNNVNEINNDSEKI